MCLLGFFLRTHANTDSTYFCPNIELSAFQLYISKNMFFMLFLLNALLWKNKTSQWHSELLNYQYGIMFSFGNWIHQDAYNNLYSFFTIYFCLIFEIYKRIHFLFGQMYNLMHVGIRYLTYCLIKEEKKGW